MDLLEQFRQAGQGSPDYRSTAFWVWDDGINPEEIRRQIREMKRAGLGGVVLPSRSRESFTSSSERWTECIRVAVDECQQVGLAAWLSLEDTNDPERAAKPHALVAETPQQKWVVVQEVAPDYFEWPERTIAAYIGIKSGDTWENLQRVKSQSEVISLAQSLPGATVLLLTYGVGENYDPLSEEAVKAYIHESEEFSQPVGAEFGKTVPGVFIDPPEWLALPWSESLPAAFQEQTGEDLLDLLPSLFFPLGDSQKVRYQFWCSESQLYARSFTEQIGKACQERGLTFTALLHSGDLASQIRSGGAAMPHYAEMGMPGVVHRGRRPADPLPIKQATSVGRQFGKPVASAMFGGAGWNVSLEEMKTIAEGQMALGVGSVLPQQSLYSLRGRLKRESAPSLHTQQPWWPEYARLNDRFARLLSVLTQGQRVADILLLHPLGSAWALFDPNGSDEADALSRHFAGISRFLLSIGRDHDYGDESLLERHGQVAGDRLQVGQASYPVVVIPPGITIQHGTARLLREFHAAGGKLILLGDGPERLDGRTGPDAEDFRSWLRSAAKVCPADEPDALESALFGMSWPRVQVKDNDGEHAESIRFQQRDLGPKQVFFFVNTDRENGARTDIALQGMGSVQEWDADTGQVSLLPVRQALGNTAFRLDFEPMQSRLIVLDSEAEPWIGTPERTSDVGLFYGEEEWEVSLLGPNALTLDTARFRVNAGEWSEPKNVLHIAEELEKREGVAEVSLEFTFENRLSEPLDSLHLVMEQPEAWQIDVNSELVESRDEGEWVDISFRKIPIIGHLNPGANTITLTRRFEGDSRPNSKEGFDGEIEAVYLLGEFAVVASGTPEKEPNRSSRLHGPFELADVPDTVSTGDLSTQGFPFFCGTLALEQEIWIPERPGDDDVRTILELETLNAAVARVVVNDQEVAKLMWKPYRLDVTDYVPEGENLRLRLELTGSCRNLLGPHHHLDGELHSVAPESFLGRKNPVDRPDAPESTWKEGYNVVDFGIAGDVLVIFEVKKEGGPREELIRKQCG